MQRELIGAMVQCGWLTSLRNDNIFMALFSGMTFGVENLLSFCLNSDDVG
jgi:hypothetical protein